MVKELNIIRMEKKLYKGANDKKEGKGKGYNFNGYYYIGQWKNDTFHGKGVLYDQNGKVRYDGEYINGKLEGNGKYYYENEDYNIGQFKNNSRHSKGILHFKDGRIIYDGEFLIIILKEMENFMSQMVDIA